MSFGGNIATMPFPDILQWLSMGSKTGTLKITLSEDNLRMVYFKSGTVIAARSSLVKDHIGKLLLREGLLNKSQLKQVLEVQKKDKSPFGTICVRLGFLSEDTLFEMLRAHSEKIIYDLFSLKEGEFIFQENELPEEQLVPISITANDLLMKGIKLRNEWEKIHEKLGSLDSIYMRPGEIELSILGLSDTEEELLNILDGTRTLSQVAERSPLSDFETYRTIASFLESGYIQRADEAEMDEDPSSVHESHQSDILGEAREFLKKKEHREAIKAVKSLLELFPEHAEAKALLLQIQREQIQDIHQTVGSDTNVPKLEIPLTDPRFQEMNIGAHEGFLLSRMDGITNIKNLANLTRIPMEDVYQILYELKRKGIISLNPPKAEPERVRGAVSRGRSPARPASSSSESSKRSKPEKKKESPWRY